VIVPVDIGDKNCGPNMRDCNGHLNRTGYRYEEAGLGLRFDSLRANFDLAMVKTIVFIQLRRFRRVVY
jgi:hypothetical protein